MNSFGRLFRMSIFGESHGSGVGVVLDGCPAGLDLDVEDFTHDLMRRGGGRPGTTSRAEADFPRIESGVHKGKSTGAPIMIRFDNLDVDSSAYAEWCETPRPGHADLVARRKFGGYNDWRGGGMFSGRMTVALVAAGVVAKKLLAPIKISAAAVSVGGSEDIDRAVSEAVADGDSVGGIVECRASGIPMGLGEPFFDSVESRISHLMFSVPAVKGVEFGAGFSSAAMRGSECNDAFVSADGRTATNHAGGISGGISNGNDLLFRVAVKPTPSIVRPQQSVNLQSGEAVEITVTGRHDACLALRVPVIAEAVAAVVLADFMLLDQRLPRIVG